MAKDPFSFNNDNEHIASLFAESMMKYKDDNRYMPIQTTRSFIKAAQKAIAEDKAISKYSSQSITGKIKRNGQQ